MYELDGISWLIMFLRDAAAAAAAAAVGTRAPHGVVQRAQTLVDEAIPQTFDHGSHQRDGTMGYA